MKKIQVFFAAFLLATSSLFVLAVPHAFAATKIWDGGGSDDNMTTAANWSPDVAPSAGDDLAFPGSAAGTVINDFTAATSFNSINFTGAANLTGYTFTGNSMTLVDGIVDSISGAHGTSTFNIDFILNGAQTFNSGSGVVDINGNVNLGSSALTITGTSSLTLDGVVSGTGSITKQGAGDLFMSGDNTYSGATTVSAGVLIMKHANALGTTAGGTTVASGAGLTFIKTSGDATVAEPLTLNGEGLNAYLATLNVGLNYNQSADLIIPYPLATFTGAITLGSNIKVGADGRNGKMTGAISGNFSISLLDTSSGTFEIASSSNGSATPNKVLAPPTKTTEYKDNSPSTSITVNTNETAIVTGTYGAVSVNYGGILKGTGTVGIANIYGKIAPGLSPGCLNTGDLNLTSTASYEFEVAGNTVCTEYDQIKVTGFTTAAGTLNITLLNNFKPTAGQKYVIISNDGTDKVTGTFSGKAEGATITAGSTSFKISYVGGDGNDVELTVLGSAPATGFKLLQANPIATAVVTIAAGLGIMIIARRSGKLFSRR